MVRKELFETNYLETLLTTYTLRKLEVEINNFKNKYCFFSQN